MPQASVEALPGENAFPGSFPADLPSRTSSGQTGGGDERVLLQLR
jgi:hypothetical protein